MICKSRKWLKKQSLAFKISLGVLLCSFMGVVILLSIVTKRSETIIKEQILKHSQHTISASVENISHLITKTEQALRALRNTLNQLDTDDTESIEIALKSTIKAIHNSGFNLSHVAIYSFPSKTAAWGKFYSAYAQDGEFFYKNEENKNFYKEFPWLKDVEKEEKIVWSEPYVSPNSPTPRMVITCVLPFKFQKTDDFTGLVSISIDLDNIRQYLDKSPFQDEGELVLLSKKGLYITHPNPKINMKTSIYELAEKLNNKKLYQIGQKVLSGQSGYTQMPFSSVYEAPTVFFYAPIPLLNWGLCLIYSKKQLFKPVYDLQIMIVVSAIAGILIMLLLIDKICYYSTRPLQNLAKVAMQYGKGDFSQNVSELRSDDEIGTLSDAFGNMRTNLLEYIKKETMQAAEKQKDLSELEIAKQIQLAALPADFPEHELFDISALMIPAKQIGGDFYDFFFLNQHKIALVIADVSGKGISAALYMMRAQEVIKHTARYTKSVAKIFERANNILCEGNKTCMFVTAFLAVINLQTGEMEYVNAGHLPPFLVDETGCTPIPLKQNFVLGVRSGCVYKKEKLKLKPNSRLFLYTDGITEAQNLKGCFYGQKRLHTVLEKNSPTPQKTIQNVITDIRHFANNAPQSDDITMLSFLYRKQDTNDLTIKADIKELHNVLAFIEHDMKHKKITPEIRSKIIVIAEELFSNIALYAYETSGKVRIKTAIQKENYCLTFVDNGKPYNPLKHQQPDISKPVAQRSVGGLGIFIAKNMADSMEYVYQNNENVLEVKVKIKKIL